jgi:hypothetical protein
VKTRLAIMTGVLLLACWLGARGLDADSLWYDEYFSIFDAGGAMFERRSPLDIWNGVAERNPWHAPGYFIVLSGWGALVGWQPPVLRALSLLLGVLAVAAVYRLGRRIDSPAVGIVAAALLATSALFIHFSHELRMYTLLVLLSVWVLWLYLRLVERQQAAQRWEWIGLLAGSAGLLYTHFFAALPLGAVCVVHLLLAPKDRRWWQITGVFALAGLLFLPWFGVLLTGIGEVVGDESMADEALSPVGVLLRIGDLFAHGNWLLLGVVVLLCAALLPRRRSTVRLLVYGGALLVFTLLVNALFQVVHEGRVRYLIAFLPPLALLTAIGIVQLGRRGGRALAGMLLAAWLLVGVWHSLDRNFAATFDGSGYLFPIHTVARLMEREAIRDDFLIGYLPSAGNPEASYRRMRAFYFDSIPIDSEFRQIDAQPESAGRHGAQVLELAGEHSRFWLAMMTDRDTAATLAIRAAVEDAYHLCTGFDAGAARLSLYAVSPACCALAGDSAQAQFGDGIALMGSEATLRGAALDVTLLWTLAPDVPLHRYSVGLKVVDEGGSVVAERDDGLAGRAYTCQPQQIDLAGLPPGAYSLRATVYHWETGERLMGRLPTGEQSDLLPLHSFTIPN